MSYEFKPVKITNLDMEDSVSRAYEAAGGFGCPAVLIRYVVEDGRERAEVGPADLLELIDRLGPEAARRMEERLAGLPSDCFPVIITREGRPFYGSIRKPYPTKFAAALDEPN